MKRRENQNGSWSEFYLGRVNSQRYENYFKNKYSLFLQVIQCFSYGGSIKEEGIGIGSVARALRGIRDVYGTDICNMMLSLCVINNPNINVWREDIFSRNKTILPNTDLVVTHGVLEHFSDFKIKRILKTYNSKVPYSIHYVPTWAYEKPSFGDERLLSPYHWLNEFKPFDHLLDNDEKDLYLIFKHI
jgi:hypothetical protein